MQAQEVPPSAATGLGVPLQEVGPEHAVGTEEQPDNGHKKKSVIGKVKEKAKKLKTKIKKPKSPGAAGENNDESSSGEEEDSGSDEQQSGERAGEEQDVVVEPGPKGQAYEAIPDPHVDPAAGVHERLAQLQLGDEPEATKPKEAPGVSPYIASGQTTEASQGIPVEEGKTADGKDLVVTPSASDDKAGVVPMDYDQPSDVSKTSDNKGAWYTPTSAEGEQQKPLKDRIVEGATSAKDSVATAAATGAGSVGLKSYDESGNTERSEESKTAFDEAKEKVFGSSEAPQGEVIESVGQNKPSITSRAASTVTGLKDTLASKLGYGSGKNLTRDSNAPLDTTPSTQSSEAPHGELVESGGQNKPSITSRATGTMTGLKDTIASKLGYGSDKNLTRDSNAPLDTTPTQVGEQNPENKSALEKIQERAAGTTAAVTSKLGYGDNQSPSAERSPSEAVGDQVNPAGHNKTYTQKAREAAFGAKDAVAAKLGYGGTSTKENVTSATEGDNKSYMQKAQETAVSAKDAVASKLGYANKDVPTAATESAYGEEQNVPASTAARFHPGEEDRALSQLITEKMSTGAATVKDTLMKPFGSKTAGSLTPTTTPPPSSAAAVEADPVHSTVGGTKPDVPQEEKAGIVGKVTGVVSSLLGTSPSGKKKAEEAAGEK
ncbi:hypothetical protein GOP47_0000599 [Adiantum capillus-veneris]|uniref:LTI65/LTI78 N-terminal domain-containing protein n=1 Tax=Adiantum capillus-veneris TaxID=13818 RepID=A0A9D4ZT82_ADICA|nr:hypothetical protein GOP47_0000599 [Adiantum capillus-veneris]